MSTLRTRTSNDSWLEIKIPDVPTESVSDVTGHVRFRPRYGARGASKDEWGFEVARAAGLVAGINSFRGEEREVFDLAGGKVRIYHSPREPGVAWAAWVGPWNLVHAMFYEPMWTRDDIVETFSRVRWTDTPDGIVVDTGSRFERGLNVYSWELEGVGTLFAERRDFLGGSADGVPSWKGRSVPSGEMWRVPSAADPSEETLLLANASTVLSLVPWDAPGRRNARHLKKVPGQGTLGFGAQFLSTVSRVSWSAK